MIKFVGLTEQIYSYLIDDGSEDEKGFKSFLKRYKKVCHKKKT